jgi:cathepsin L
LEGYTFDKFVTDFNRHYSNQEEFEMRRNLFETRIRDIIQHNKDTTKTWKRGVNEFSDLTEKEFQVRLGVRRELLYQSRRNEAHVSQKETPAHVLRKLPTSIDWRQKNPSVVTPVKDQGSCGSCWSFAAAQSIESQWALATGELQVLSEQNILGCTENPQQCGGTGGCGGATSELAFETVIASGIASEWTYPYISYRGDNYQCQFNPTLTPPVANISSYVVLPVNQYSPLMDAISTKGPIAISVDAGAWGDYESGIFNGCNQTNPVINHGVQLVGYGTDNGTDYWLVRNSWAPSWGEKGYIRLYRTSEVQCGTDLEPLTGTGCVGGPSTVTVCGTCGILYATSYPVV